jgi:DNA-binding GntR family transcriptional regulator
VQNGNGAAWVLANATVRRYTWGKLFPKLRVSAMSDVTRILSAIEQGDPHAAEKLLPLVYDELHKRSR